MNSFKISVVKVFSVLALMLMLGTSVAFAQVTFPTAKGLVGSTVTVPITTTDLTAMNVTSYQFDLAYNPSIIEITGVSAVGTLSAGVPGVYSNITSGMLKVAWAGTKLTGAGTLLNVTIKFLSSGTVALNPGATFLANGSNSLLTVTAGSASSATVAVNVDNMNVSGLASEILIPIRTSALVAADNAVGYDFTLTYDATKLEIKGYTLDNTIATGGYVAENNTVAGTYKLAWARASALSGSGVIAYVKAKVKVKSTINVVLSSFKFNAGLPVTVAIDGLITVVNQKPVFAAATQTLTGNENAALALTVVATDGDSDVLTYSATGLPTGATLSTAGAFAWTPTYAQAGTYTVVITASDGSDTATMTLNITVKDVNRVPKISLSSASPFTIGEGTELKFKVITSDDDTDNTLTLSATGVPSGATFTAATGDFSWTPNFKQEGSYLVIFTVKDNFNANAATTAAITVTNVNGAPRFDVAGGKQMPDTTIKAGVNFVFTFKAIDPQGDVVNYFLNQPAPSNAIIVPSTGVFGWRPANTQAGMHYIVVSASDGVLTTNSRIATVTVQPDLAVEESGIPTAFELFQNYPNPFNPTTNIKYALPKESRVRIAVFNILGQEVATLVNSVMPAGYHSVDFKANSIPSGMYIYKIETESFSQVKKMLLMK